MPDKNKKILATVRNRDKENFKPIAVKLSKMGYDFVATENTAKYLNENGIMAETVKKVREAKPNIIDLIRSSGIGVVVDIPTKANDVHTDGFRIRRTAVEASINVFTSLDTVSALADIMETGITAEDVDVYNISR